MSKIIETCPNRSSFSWLESCIENLKRKQQIMCIICKNDNWNWKSCWVLNMNILVAFFLEIVSTWARNQKTRVFKSTWHPTQSTKEGVCVIGQKSGAIHWCTKVIFHFLSSYQLHFWNSCKEHASGLNTGLYFGRISFFRFKGYDKRSMHFLFPNTYTLHKIIAKLQFLFLMSLISPTGFESDKQEVI